MATSPASGGGRPQAKGRVIPFGKYLLLERLAVGGMAEVFLSKSFGIEGFEKIIAIKRILPTMAEDEDFIEMFIDEAKIAGQLNHANVVPIYELGKIGDSHYIAMEYVWGKDLLQIMNRFRRMRKRMPPAMVAFVASRMCEALEYAHTKRDRAGKPLNLIHRDISPQNILVSYEGAVKLIDFGIAKAASRTTKTQAGVLKGKFGYMSPEQVRGLPIDHRSDIFAVGTCMYEMLTADRLFLGESDFSTLEKVRHATVSPLSEMVPGIPPQLEEVIMKALSREPADRWQSAGELQEALQEFLATQRPPFTTSKLASWMKAAFSKEMGGEKAKLDGFAHVGRPSVLGAPAAPPKPSAGAKRTMMGLGPSALSATARPNPPRKDVQPPQEPSIAELDPSDLIEDDEVEELVSDATMVTASPFEEMEGGGGGFDDLEEEATTVFFVADGDAAEQPAAPVAVMPSGSVQVFSPPVPDPVQGEATRAAPIESFTAGGGAVPKPMAGVSLGSGQAQPVGFDDDRPTLMLDEEAVLPSGQQPIPGPGGPPGMQVQTGAPMGFAAPPPTAAAPGQQRHLQTMEMGSIEPDKNDRIKKFAMIGVAAVLLIGLGVGGAFMMLGGGGGGAGTIEVRTVPDVNAEVRIDGIGRGHAPVRISEVPAGSRQVQVVAEGYETIERTIDVGEGSTAALDLVLVASARPTAVASNTMVTTAMLPTVMDTVAPTMTEEVAAQTDTDTEPETMEAEAAPPTMEPVSQMTSEMTTTMRTQPRDTEGEQMIIRRTTMEDPPGFMVIMRTETMMRETMMTARRGRGRLVVNSQPWSKVFVDGRERGNTPQPSLTVSAGSHRIELRTQDGRTHRRTVEVENGGTVRVIHRF